MFVVDQPFGVGVRAEASFSMVPASSAVVVVVVESRLEAGGRKGFSFSKTGRKWRV